jgi:Ca-activated chloride channel homolog
MPTASTLIRPCNKQNRRHRRRAWILTAGAVALTANPAKCPAQEQNASPQQAIRVASDLVRLSVSVLDDHGNFVGGLQTKDFRVLDNGAEQPVVFFASVDAPAEVLLMVETSPAVYLIHDEHLVAAYELLDGLAPDDAVALAAYDEAPHALVGFTTDRSQLLTALANIQFMIGRGQLNFYDSLSQAIDWLPPAANKRAVILLTTGLDSSAPARWDALVQKLGQRDVAIYSVALGGSLRSYNGKKATAKKKSNESKEPAEESAPDSSGGLSFASANKALESLAAMTGGRAFFPEKATDFETAYKEIAATLRHQYVLGIAPAHDGQYHTLTIEVLGSNGLPLPAESKKGAERIFFRKGYLAPGS